MYKAFFWIGLFVGYAHFLQAIPNFNCPDIEIEMEEGAIEIKDLEAPLEIVKVFNASYSLVYECNGNCQEDLELSDLPAGIYHIDIQSYTKNWQFICDLKQSITIKKGEIPSCSAIDIAINEDVLTIKKLIAPNKIVKVFDVFYNLIYLCYANCGESVVIPSMLSGLYHLDIQFYTENWQYLCQRRDDILVDLENIPCDLSPCQGNISLETQAEVDAFCGCKTVEGNVTIGKEGGSTITSLANLRDIQQINGSLSVIETKIKDFDGLGNLGYIGKSLVIQNNLFLKTFTGLNNLVHIEEAFKVENNPKIANLMGLDRLKEVKLLHFKKNSGLKKLDKIAQITNLTFLTLEENHKLVSLPQLVLIDKLSGLTIEKNNGLKNLEFLRPIPYIEGAVNINNNPSLSDCCGMNHLIDEDPFFGTNNAIFTIYSNPFPCKSMEKILLDCQPNEPSCSDIQINKNEDKITITGLTARYEILKIFDENYQILFECFGDCENSIQLENLAAGIYRSSINFYDENWIPICENRTEIELTNSIASSTFNNRSSNLFFTNSSDFSIFPNPAQAEIYVDLHNLFGKKVHLQLINQFGQKVSEHRINNVSQQPQLIDVSQLQNGLYFLQIQSKNRKLINKKIIINRLY